MSFWCRWITHSRSGIFYRNFGTVETHHGRCKYATNGKGKRMFEHKQRKKHGKKEILSMVEGYYQAFHAKKKTLGKETYCMLPAYDQDEMYNLVDSALEFWLTSGRYTTVLKGTLRIILVCVLFACQFRVFGKSAGVYGTDTSHCREAACEACGDSKSSGAVSHRTRIAAP